MKKIRLLLFTICICSISYSQTNECVEIRQFESFSNIQYKLSPNQQLRKPLNFFISFSLGKPDVQSTSAIINTPKNYEIWAREINNSGSPISAFKQIWVRSTLSYEKKESIICDYYCYLPGLAIKCDKYDYKTEQFDWELAFPSYPNGKYEISYRIVSYTVLGTMLVDEKKTELFTYESILECQSENCGDGYYYGGDSDGDGTPDGLDNCVTIANPDQVDTDNDGIGDSCDNCVNTPNRSQTNTDNDSYGNACDNDDDNDGIPDSRDNCPLIKNSDQMDSDNDGIGNACDDSNNNALPNLKITGLKVKVDNNTYNVFNGQIPILKKDKNATFEITITNNDDGLSTSSKTEFLASVNSDSYPIANQYPVYGMFTTDVGSVIANSSETASVNYQVGIYIGGINLQNGGTYYMYGHVDYQNDVQESNELDSDNVIVFAFQYSSSTNRNSIFNASSQKLIGPSNESQKFYRSVNEISEAYDLKIFSFEGILLKTNQVENKQEEMRIINDLPSGQYIIKTKYKTYKIHKLN